MTCTATCHCGAARLTFPVLDLASARRCNCSMCVRRGAITVTVPVGDLVVEAGHTLRLYQFHTRTAEHWFCGTCGIYTHHRRHSNRNECGVNLACVAGVDIPSVAWTWTDGRNHPKDR